MSGVYKKSDNQSSWHDIGGTYIPVQRTGEGQTFDLLQLTSGAESRLFQLTNLDIMESTYKGVNFQINKRMSNRWQANFGMTYSKSEGRQGSSWVRATPATSPISVAASSGACRSDGTPMTSSTPMASCRATGRWC